MSRAQVVVDHGNTAVENWGLIGLGVVLAIVAGLVVVGASQLRDWLDTKRDAAATQAAVSADAGRSLAAAFVPKAADVAESDAKLAKHPGAVERDPVFKRDMPGRLVQHRAKYGIQA